ncbi:beta-ketoacyl-[acyl-carrier-protein] synthase family protein [Butyrivibrio sp. AE2032]|uniref:beta-ketoacyl-[acyl-carrier-protein] synthase family protein n=1 Tax=Butyrivibrio sp. AE2032 TaxID=1458463 RepID=UPI000558717E|nr:beta-ketoacyl-[acyl-carrier-protein] synthase family protein [Butyrivibrio sp. AE2032]
MLMNERRCVITGLGLVCAIGNDTEESFKSALNGISGIKDVKSFDTSSCYSHKGAEVELTNEQLANGKYDRTTALGIKAAGEAIKDSGIDMDSEDASKIGVILGSCIAGAACVEKYYNQKCKGEKGDLNDLKSMPATVIAGNVADYYNCGGITANIVNACAAGTLSVALAIDLIRGGKGEIFLAGGCDSFSSLAFSGFHALRALDASECSPFNHSEGITLGEGAGVLVVESYEHAIKRGARIYCDVLGSGVSSDAYHITAPRPDGEGQMSVIERAIKNSGLDYSDIDYVNAHGTGTAKNDESEFLSLKTSFAGNDHVSASSTKSMTGHCLGAAGAIEAVLTVKALTEGKLPPTSGYSEEDLKVLAEKSGNIDFIANKPRERDIKYAMSNSFAFGGNNASIVFAKDPNKLNLLCPKQDLYVTGIGIVNGEFDESTNAYTAKLDADMFKAYGVKSAFLRKLDRLSQLQLLSGVKALEDAGITVTPENEGIIGICIGTNDGPMTEIANFQKGIIKDGIEKGSAFAFPNTVYNAAGGYLSIFTGIKGYNVTIANGFQSGLQSVCAAAGAIMFGYESIMLATGTDECTEIDEEIYTDLGYTGNGSFKLGEGSVTCVIEKASCAVERGAKRYAKIGGFSSARDTSGDRNNNTRLSEAALTKVIENVLEEAQLKAEDISCIYGFGNGIEEIDSFEMEVYKKIFGEGIEVKLVKKDFGEARAASSSLQFAMLAKDIYEGRFENGIAVSFGTSALYSALLLTKA